MVSPFENPFPTRGRGPWTPRGAAGSRWFLRMPSTGRDAPTASCSVMGYSFVIVSLFESRARFLPRRQQRFRVGDPSNRPAGSVGMTVRVSRRDSKVWQRGRMAGTRQNPAAAGPYLICHPERAARAEGSPTRNPSHQRRQNFALFSKNNTKTIGW